MYLKARIKEYMSRPTVNCPLVIGIPKPDNYFDYVRQRFLIAAIPVDKWKKHIRECTRICASDGWVEIIEMSTRIVGGGPACQQFNTWTIEGLKSRGVDMDMAQDLDRLMREAGLINVTKQIFTAPIGPWGGKAGELFAESFRLASGSAQPFIMNVFNVSKEEVDRNCTLMMEEFKSRQTYMHIYVYLGQKQ
jgi:hypothetical protein